jgi:hypothetical protein
MNNLEVFLREHAAVHSRDAVPAPLNMDWVFAGHEPEQLRARPHGLNSIAWLLWHIARTEDCGVSLVITAQPQLLDDAWAQRLNVNERGDGEGMTKAQVEALSQSIDLDVLREYRNAVCVRTRAMVEEMWPERWEAPLTADDLREAAARGALGGKEAPWLVGIPRDALLSWWAVQHSQYHLGQIAMLRSLGL